MKKNYNKLSESEKNNEARIRQQDKAISKHERDFRNLDAKYNILDTERIRAQSEKMISVNAVSSLTREIEFINKESEKS